MRYRALSPTGDYQFGREGLFLVDSPAAVAQAVRTRLALWSGSWFLDLLEGTDYMGGVLGTHTQGTRDLIMKGRILETQGVTAILSYSSSTRASDRTFSVNALLETQYGTTTVSA